MRKPPLEIQPTTLWDYPSQHYGEGMQGDRKYTGATPSYVIWNLLSRYTRPGDLVVDPFCGSGTSIDVAHDLGREVRGFDVHPYRPDIENADARALPLEDASVDFWFADPPYGDNLYYGDDPRCIGQYSATDETYFEALEQVFAEAFRVLKDRRYLGFYIADFHSKKQGFVPIGLRCLAIALKYFKPIDHISVVRHNRTLSMGQYRRAAVDENFFLRGFNHLLILKKELSTEPDRDLKSVAKAFVKSQAQKPERPTKPAKSFIKPQTRKSDAPKGESSEGSRFEKGPKTAKSFTKSQTSSDGPKFERGPKPASTTGERPKFRPFRTPR